MRIKSKLKDIFDILLMSPWWLKASAECASRFMVSLVLGIASVIMCILNYINHSELMLYSSVILVVGFAVSAVSAKVFNRADISGSIIAALVCLILSVFVYSGGNDGFAALWVLLVPILAVNVLGVTRGFITATYFLLFLFILFYSPLRTFVADSYSEFFITRFPVLYFSDYVLSLYLSFQKEYFSRRVHLQAYTDGLTGCYNRRYFNEHLKKLSEKENAEFSIVLIDINGLKKVNDTMGHDAGDELICAVPDFYSKTFGVNENAVLCRTGGDEYVILAEMPSEKLKGLLAEMKEKADKWKGRYSDSVHYAVGCVSNKENPELTIEELQKKADALMYEDKSAYYRNSGNDRRRR